MVKDVVYLAVDQRLQSGMPWPYPSLHNMLFALCSVGVLVLLCLLFTLEVMSDSFAAPWTVDRHLLCP